MQTNSGLISYRVANYLTERHANLDNWEGGGDPFVFMTAEVTRNCKQENQERPGNKSGLDAYLYDQHCEAGSTSVVFIGEYLLILGS